MGGLDFSLDNWVELGLGDLFYEMSLNRLLDFKAQPI